jgi:hypothetical protein
MPDNQALQTFYGTIPLILVIAGVFFRSQLVWKDVLERLRRSEETLASLDKRVSVLDSRVAVLETSSTTLNRVLERIEQFIQDHDKRIIVLETGRWGK